MDLTRSGRRWFVRAALGAALVAAGACSSSDSGVTYGENDLLLPATLKEALVLADRVAKEWADNAYVTELGGGFTIMDANGRSENHTFVYHARVGAIRRFMNLHMIGGIVWHDDQITGFPEQPFADLDSFADSDAAVAFAINLAEDINAATADSIPVTEKFAAALLSRPQWPPAGSGIGGNPELAWRVDFLVFQAVANSSTPVPFSTVRFYLDPVTLAPLGDPVVPAFGPELYSGP
jgi:hypothetical protein